MSRIASNIDFGTVDLNLDATTVLKFCQIESSEVWFHICATGIEPFLYFNGQLTLILYELSCELLTDKTDLLTKCFSRI